MISDIGKRQVFVGSSTEGKHLAEIVIAQLDSVGLQPLPWFDVFKSQRPPIQELEQRRQDNRDTRQRPNVRDNDVVELARDFEVPTTEENLLVYDGTQPISEWIHGTIPRAARC